MKKILLSFTGAILFALIASPVHADKAGVILNGKLISLGATGITGASAASTDLGNEYRSGPEVDKFFGKGGVSSTHVPAAGVPRPASTSVRGAPRSFFGFNGLTHLDQRLADNGNQFSLEPPDPALAVGNNFVLQAVNNALAVYDQTGHLLAGPIALNPFFGLPSALERGPNTRFGPFTSDPKCYYDPPTGRWFVTVLEVDVDPVTGDFLNQSSVRIAVSKTSDPRGAYYLYALDTTTSGLPDQPLIGADANGFYISINSFLFPNFNFNGGQIFALSKLNLENGSPSPVVFFSGLQQAEGPGYSIQPATVPPGGSYEHANGGTEYFLSALDFNAKIDDRITVWAITNTSSLNDRRPNLSIQNIVIRTEVYGQPPDAAQCDGPTPLADLIRSGAFGFKANNRIELIAANDDRMQQVVFAAGKLWSAVNTVVKTENGPTRVGIAYFIVRPSFNFGTLSATIANQGYLAVNGNNVMYPAIGVNASGRGAMAFTLVGPDFCPSAAYTTIDSSNGTGVIRRAAAGAGPYDSFGGYKPFSRDSVARWGDYHTAVADADGSIWFDVEYVPDLPRTLLTNWGTFVGNARP